MVLGRDSTPVTGMEVALHRIAGESGGVVDRDTSRDGGRFRLRGAAPPDSGVDLYLAATRYRGVLYFGRAYRGGEEPSEPYVIQVFETAAPPPADSLPVGTRHLILRPAGDGSWAVTDLVQVQNASDRTYVPAAEGGEVWSVALPDRAAGAEVAESGMSAGEVRIAAGRVRAASSLSPGGTRVSVRYSVPEGEPVTLPTRHPVERLEILVQGEGGSLASASLGAAGPVRFRDSVYQRYTATGLRPGTRVEFTVGGGAGGPGLLPWLFAGLGVLLLAAAGFFWARQRGGTGGPVGPAGGAAAVALAALAGAAGGGAPTASAAPAAGADTIRIPDDRGDTLVLPGPARRVVSLIPAATELVFAVGSGDRLVGRTRYGTHPPAAREVPSVGEGIRPSVESVVARRPDAVLVYAGQTNSATFRRFEELGVPVLAMEHNTIPQLMRNIRRLGLLTGRESAADSLAAAIRSRLAAVAGVVRGRRRVRVYYDLWPDPPRTVGAGSYLDSLISVAGGRNVFGDLEGPSPLVSLETVVERRPDVVVVPRGAGGERVPPGERPGWGKLRAVKAGDVVAVDAGLMDRLGPRLGEAAAHLAAALHPAVSDSLRRLGLLPRDSGRVGYGPSSPSPDHSPRARATTCGAPSSGPGPGWRTTRTGQR